MKNYSSLFDRLRILFFALFLCPIGVNAATIFVNHAAVGANNGTSWADAFTSLSDALAAGLPGDEIWVAQGVYKPETLIDLNSDGGIDPREAAFLIPSDVKVFGGFTGSEATLEERDWEINLTILSGDIDNNDTNLDGNFIAEVTDDIVGNNSYHVVYTNNVSINTWLDGFIITAGSASIAVPVDAFDPNLDGGGWYNRLAGGLNASSPSIYNTTFQGNFAESEGGAMYNVGTADGEILSVIGSCKFINNKSDQTGGAIHLGSFSPGTYEPHIIQCQFISNIAFRRGGALNLIGDHAKIDSSIFIENMVTAISMDFSTLPGSGGAANMVASNAAFYKCIFTGNKATGNPTGAFEGGGGGAVYMVTNEPQTTTLGASEPKFISCGFYSNIASDNTAAWGGAAVHLSDAGILIPKYINCVFNDNQAQNDGGAIANFTRVISEPDGFTPALEPEFTNCTFTDNQAGQRGGAIFNDGFLFMGAEILQSRLENSILWNNSAVAMGPEVHNLSGDNFVTYSLVEGSGGSGGGWDISIGIDGGNNIDEDPDFNDEADPIGTDNIPATIDDGLGLSGSSPAVNAGNDAAPGLAGISKDYVGITRILFGQVDMGAYERCGVITPDLDIYWLTNWDPVPPPCLTCPPNWSFILFDNFKPRVFTNIDELLPQEISKAAANAKSILPFGFPQALVWDGPAQLINNGDFSIVIGKIVNPDKAEIAFNVYLKLINQHNWESWEAKGKTYFAYTGEAVGTAATEHINWTYWELSSESYLEGTGDISGKINLDQWPASEKTGFQLGEGANGMDADNGLGGLFSYKGKITYKGSRQININGIGSLNADAELCTENCEPLEQPKSNPNEPSSESKTALPVAYNLSQNYPNPFNPTTRIEYSIPETGIVKLIIYNLLGEIVAILVNEIKESGTYSVNFNAAEFNSGVYFYHLQAGEKVFTRKMTLIK